MFHRTKVQLKRAEGNEPGVYGLKDPHTGAIRYVGSSVHVSVRYHAHCTGCGNPVGAKRKWLQGLKELGLVPDLVVLERHDAYDKARLLAAEKAWIAQYRAKGEADLNIHHSEKRDTPYSRLQRGNEALRRENALLRDLLLAG